ncbi:MAG TPA: hypothetical protein VF765_36515 [Polyangiaceae bacterium]
MQTKRHLAGLALMGSFALATAAVGCSLGLDKSKIGEVQIVEGGPENDGPLPEGFVPEGGDGPVTGDGMSTMDGPPQANAGACTKDSDCQAAAGDAGGCVSSAKCDPTWHVCMLDVCNAGACKAEECNTSTNTCTLPSDYSGMFNPTSFQVSYGGIGPQGPQWSIAAVWPFVFLITTNGVVAYNVSDPVNTSPQQVTIHGVPFIPDWTLRVGRRVYFITRETGGPTFHQAVAWIDVPQNPFITQFTANTVWAQTMEKNGITAIVGDGVAGFYMAYNSDPLQPTTDVHAPLSDGTQLTAFDNNNFPMSSNIVSASGGRLVAYSYDGTQQAAQYTFVSKPATTQAQAGSLGAVDAMGPVDNQQTWSEGDDGSVLWEAAQFEIVDGGSDGQIAQTCLTWLLDSSSATSFDAAKCAALESYSPAISQGVTVTPAWIDATTALGFAAASSNPNASTSVHVVNKKANGSPITMPGVVAYVPVGPGNVGTSSSNGFGYALARTDPMNNQSCTVYIFAPACAGGGG